MSQDQALSVQKGPANPNNARLYASVMSTYFKLLESNIYIYFL